MKKASKLCKHETVTFYTCKDRQVIYLCECGILLDGIDLLVWHRRSYTKDFRPRPINPCELDE